MTSYSLKAALESIQNQEADPLVLATIRGLLRGYDAKWRESKWRTLDVEGEYVLPLINPDTGRASRTWANAGKRDGIAAYNDKTFLVEHKTCSEDIADPNAPYWRRLEIDSQVSGYVLSSWQEGTKLDGTLYDVIRKPSIAPKILAKAEAQRVVVTGLYLNEPVSQESRQAVASGEGRENPELFEIRLGLDVLQRPEFYFQRRTIYRMDNQLLDHAREAWLTADEMRLANTYHRHYRNSDACMNWGRPCEFLELCSGHTTIDGDRYKHRPKVHSELNTPDKYDGLELLTHSRMSCFKTCKQKHHYRYNLGLEKVRDEEAESLTFGRILHIALAQWWNCFRVTEGESHEYRNGNSSPASGDQPVASETAVAC